VASLVRTAVHNQVGYLGMNIFKGAGADQFYDDFGGGTVVTGGGPPPPSRPKTIIRPFR
jgi:hypothetical protein